VRLLDSPRARTKMNQTAEPASYPFKNIPHYKFFTKKNSPGRDFGFQIGGTVSEANGLPAQGKKTGITSVLGCRGK
jgi:hypothetical protein